ncbi:MAG: hypothetical protein R2795_01920 [Saprospiraceae bacterium]
MTQAPTLMPEQLAPREVIAIPQVDEFYDMLQYRLNMIASDFVFSRPFTIFLNVLPRQRTMFIDRYANVQLIYGGIKRQRELLCQLTKSQQKPHLDKHWDFLDYTALDSETAVVSSQLYQSFASGSYKLSDISQKGNGLLRDYFKPILDAEYEGTPATPRQIAEYNILKEFFDIQRDHYLSIPLVLFGEFDGVMHFVYSEDDGPAVRSRAIGALIRSSSAMIETQMLEWDLVGRNPEKSKAILLPLEEDFYRNVNRNPILKELGFHNYYRKYIGFYQKRIRFNDDVIHSKVYRPYLKAAITAIMIDSFAHNVSAHSLVALNWWFKQRAESIRNFQKFHRSEVREMEELVDAYMPIGYDRDRVLTLLKPWITGLFVKDADPEYDLVNFSGPLAREIQPLLKFLMQKGAFWSGIARDNHFGGESASFFEVLWNDFINNPLYLGTIAKSEDIHRIRFRVIVYEPRHIDAVDENRPEYQPKKPVAEGVFVEVDLKKRRPDVVLHPNGKRGYPLHDEVCLCLEEYPELEEMSDFVAPGKDYIVLKEALEQCRMFFPGEVVGRHAVFTLLENEIRNVKHYKGDILRKMQREGLELCISLQECPVRPGEEGEKALYSIGIWLNAPTQLVMKDGDILPKMRYANLSKDIMDEATFAPRLGGSSQDKLCAGMLFNNYFLSVQNGDGNELRDRSDDTERDTTFYPWIIPASSPVQNMHDDTEFKVRNQEEWAQLRARFTHETGFLKKYFHIWKAADIHWIYDLEDAHFVWDNLARFKFIGIKNPQEEMRTLMHDEIRSKGVLRVINSQLPQGQKSDAALCNAYQLWLKTWMGDLSMSIQLFVDNALSGQFVYDPANEPVLRFYPAWEVNKGIALPSTTVSQQLYIAHGGDAHDHKLLRYRNHGIFVKYFKSEWMPGQPLSDKARLRTSELFEVLSTRICVFDSRVYYRLGNSEHREALAQQMLLHVYDETNQNEGEQDWLGHWETEKEWIINQTHFLVLHLSFIEKILITKYSDHKDYSDENIGLFIEQEIMPFARNENGLIRENFVLVITTGRGRTKWWTKLSEQENYQQYKRFTNFRPVESIISAIEDAVNRRDDIEVKYNLVKVMFGS